VRELQRAAKVSEGDCLARIRIYISKRRVIVPHTSGWSYGIAEHLTKHGLLFCVDAHRDGKRFIVKADDLLTAFLSLERDAIASKGANGSATR
jgi:hypothetical protein